MAYMQPWGISRKGLKRMLAARRLTLKPDTRSPIPSFKREAVITLSVYDMRIRTEIAAGARGRTS